MRALAICAVLAAGCVKDAYRCDRDEDCDLGEAGRCEADHLCTRFEPSCASGHAYTAHSGELTGVCYDDRVALANACTAGAPPALPEGCAADVCAALPSCCSVGWTDACVEQAQLRCELACDTRIAITATKGTRAELWDLRWDGSAWSAVARPDLRAALSWLAPAPGTAAPRLGGIAADAFVLDDGTQVPITTRTYQDVSSVDLDHDGRDTIALSSNTPGDPASAQLDVVSLVTGATRTIATDGSLHPTWGDYDHDAFPDVVTGSGNRYVLAASTDAPDHARTLITTVAGTLSGAATTGSPQLRAIEWNDVDGDGVLDLIASGNVVRVHLGSELITNVPTVTIDCAPPASPPGGCDGTLASFTAAVVPGAAGARLVLASFPDRALYRATLHAGPPATVDVAPIRLPACPMCAPIIALVARDLDHDRTLDLIAIDADLHVFTTRSSQGGAVESAFVIPTTLRGFGSVAVSVAGATP